MFNVLNDSNKRSDPTFLTVPSFSQYLLQFFIQRFKVKALVRFLFAFGRGYGDRRGCCWSWHSRKLLQGNRIFHYEVAQKRRRGFQFFLNCRDCVRGRGKLYPPKVSVTFLFDWVCKAPLLGNLGMGNYASFRLNKGGNLLGVLCDCLFGDRRAENLGNLVFFRISLHIGLV